jgi:signal transduction histidine kinase
MPTGGLLSIKAETVGDNIAILIHDTGCGIPPEVMSRIHEPFFTTKHHGNGLGLSICRSIIGTLGGRIEIESQTGVGTQVKVLLPIVSDKMAGATA